jgi:hypothetical protein
MLGWLMIASVFSVAYRPARQGQKVAYLTLVSFVFLVFVLSMLLLGKSDHSRGRTAISRAAEGQQELQLGFMEYRP